MEVTRALAQEVCELSRTIKEGQDILVKEILETASGKWFLWVLYVLAKSGSPMRFTDIFNSVSGISYKMLSKTLKSLERDGLVVRHAAKRQVPPCVEYQLSPLGREMLQAMTPLWKWIVSRIEEFEAARGQFQNSKV